MTTPRVHVVQKVNQLLTSAISTGVSDIHFEPFEVVFRVRYRIDGVLKDVEHLPGTNKVNQVSYVYGSNRDSTNQITNHSNYVYDANGSVLSTSKLNKTLLMDYDIRSNLVSSIAVNNQYIIDYDYDASGERVYSGMGNSSKIYINSITSNPLTIIDSNDNVTHYIYGPKGIVAKRNESLTYYMLKDHLGSTRVVMNENNQAISSYDYDAWGNPMNSTVSEMSAYRYTGREYDDETGLHNFRARLYDSTLMRFYQVDPAEQFASPYVYCGNNPILFKDYTGLEAFIVGPTMKTVYKESKKEWSIPTKFDKVTGQISPKKGFQPTTDVERYQYNILTSQSIRVTIRTTEQALEMASDGTEQMTLTGGFSNGAIRNKATGVIEAEQIVHNGALRAQAFFNDEKIGKAILHEFYEGFNIANSMDPSIDQVYYNESYQSNHDLTLQQLNQKEWIVIPQSFMQLEELRGGGGYRVYPFYNGNNSIIKDLYPFKIMGDTWHNGGGE